MPDENSFYKDLIDNLYDGVYFVDRDRLITYWNKGAERITGYKKEIVIGRSCRDNLLNHVGADGEQLCVSMCPLAKSMEDGNVQEVDVFLHHADGHRIPVLVRTSPLRDDDGKIIGAVETFSTDTGLISVREQLKELRQAVHTDGLTNIGSRRFIEGRLHAIIAERDYLDSRAAVLFIDIDHFKGFNDTYGHDVGDKALWTVGATLTHAIRKTDAVGRWGGEEFVLILNNVHSEDSLRVICEKLRSLVERSSINLNDETRLTVTISIGATLLQVDDTPETVVKRADTLMYQSKQQGRNRVSIG